jgi:hypothetical protein
MKQLSERCVAWRGDDTSRSCRAESANAWARVPQRTLTVLWARPPQRKNAQHAKDHGEDEHRSSHRMPTSIWIVRRQEPRRKQAEGQSR